MDLADLLADDPGGVRRRELPDLLDELLDLVRREDQASERHEEDQERKEREDAEEGDRPGHVHQLVLDEPLLQSEEEFLPGDSTARGGHRAALLFGLLRREAVGRPPAASGSRSPPAAMKRGQPPARWVKRGR